MPSFVLFATLLALKSFLILEARFKILAIHQNDGK